MFTWNVFAIISCLTFALSSREKDFCSSSFICVHGGNRSGTHLTTAALPKRLLHMKFSGTAKVASSNSLKIFDRGSSQLSVKSVCLSAQFCLFGGHFSLTTSLKVAVPPTRFLSFLLHENDKKISMF